MISIDTNDLKELLESNKRLERQLTEMKEMMLDIHCLFKIKPKEKKLTKKQQQDERVKKKMAEATARLLSRRQ